MLDLAELFRSYMPGDPPAAGELWLWTGPTDKDGYGRLFWGGKYRRAHRVSYELFRGSAAGLVVRHDNDTPLDVNPHNLLLGTVADNNADKLRRGRVWHPVGELNGRAKLTAGQALNIRDMYQRGGVRQVDLAAAFGVSQSTVSAVIRGGFI